MALFRFKGGEGSEPISFFLIGRVYIESQHISFFSVGVDQLNLIFKIKKYISE